MDQNLNKTCEGCGAAITADQITQRKAGLVGGKLLCPNCVDQKRRELMNARATQAPAVAVPAARPAVAVGGNAHPAPATASESASDRVYIPSVGVSPVDSIALLSDDEVGEGSGLIRSFSEASTLAGSHKEFGFKRPLSAHNEPATRCRTFHGKLTAAGLSHMDEQINEWLDAHPDVFIKSSNSTVGVFEGKTKEPHLLVTVFY